MQFSRFQFPAIMRLAGQKSDIHTQGETHFYRVPGSIWRCFNRVLYLPAPLNTTSSLERPFYPCLYSQVFPRGIRRPYVASCLLGSFCTLPCINSILWWNGIEGRQKGSHLKHISHWNMLYYVCCKPHDISKQPSEHRNSKWNYSHFLSISTSMPEQNYQLSVPVSSRKLGSVS